MNRSKKSFLFFTLFLISFFSAAQQYKIDSLITVLKTVSEDTTQINIFNSLSKLYANIGHNELALQYAQKALQKSEPLVFKNGIAAAYLNIGNIYWNKADYKQASDVFLKALQILQQTGDKKGMGKCYNNIGTILLNEGHYEKALENFLRSFKIKEEIGDKQGMSMSYLNIGNLYLNQRNYDKALDCYSLSLKINMETGNKMHEATNLNNIGIIYAYKENPERSLEYHLKALKIREEIGDKNGIGMSHSNIGIIYYDKGDYKKALENELKALEINIEIENNQGIATSYTNIGNIYMGLRNFQESFRYHMLSLNLLKSVGYIKGIQDSYFSLSELFDKKGDYKQALNYHKLYCDIKDTLLNEQSSKQIAEMNTKYDSEKKDKELIKKDAEINKQQAQTEKQTLQRNAFIAGFFLVLVLAFFIYRGYRQKQTANGLLEGKNLLIKNQKELVEEKNLKITHSINYAKRIQQAILPSLELIKAFLPESFIFFRPKDIVSGDFYWFSEKKDQLLIAVADCNGHGVPGAFMSMIGNTLLNEIVNVKNIVEPAQILNQLNKGIVNLLNQSSNVSSTQDDGMDITILSINKTTREIELASANHFSYLYNNNGCETLQGDVYSIGGMFGKLDLDFMSKKIKAMKGDTLYLFTDGFIDQFGGEKNSKFLSRRFEQLLTNIQQQGMEHQKEKLITAFDDWKGNNKQLDDLLIVGIRL